MHSDFTVFPRVVPSGKRVFYYYAYDGKGARLGPWTTGQASRTLAKNFCNKLDREGKLIPTLKGIPTFADFAVAFWDWEKSPYLKERRKRRKLTQAYADKNKNVVEHTLIPYFGKMRLDEISGEVIDKWLDYMIAEKFANSTTNSYFSTLQVMMKWAAKRGIVQRDPFLDVDKLLNEKKDKEIINHDEFFTLFGEGWEKAWDNDLLLCTAHKLAALTGIRCCEVLGLRGEFVFDDHIYICAQYDNKYGYRATKTKTKHHIPLTAEVIDDLNKLKAVNGDGFLFSLTGGDKPVSRKHIWAGLRKALKNIGMSKEDIETRGLNVHAWRHFCNTELQKAELTVKKVQAVTGHKTEQMTERYTHFDPMDFGEVPEIQAALLAGKPGEKKNERPALTLVKMPIEEKAEKKKRAS